MLQFFICLFIYLLIYFWFAYFLLCLCDCYVIACSFSFSFIFTIASSGREGCALSSFCIVVFLLFSPRGKGYFILHVVGVRNSSSAGQSLSYISILEAYISFEGGRECLAVNQNHYDIPRSLFLYTINPNVSYER